LLCSETLLGFDPIWFCAQTGKSSSRAETLTDVEEKRRVVNTISADVVDFQLADSCIQVALEGNSREDLAVVRK